MLVPFLGIRLGPFHKALQDTYDEAVTITTILRGLVNFYMAPPPAQKKQAVQSSISSFFGGGGSSSSATAGGGGGA